MNDRIEPHDTVRAELAQLRHALRALPPPPSEEAVLRAAFRARAVNAPRAPRVRTARRYWAAAAALLALVGASLVWLGARGVAPPAVVASAAAPAPVADAAAFQPLLYAPGWSPAGAYSVVRVRIPLSSFALVPDTVLDGSVEADLLIGEDGLARGIRFPSEAALGASAATNPGESR